MSQYQERQLIFSDEVETILASAGLADDARAKYRHTVMTTQMSPLEAAEYVTSGAYREVLSIGDVPETVSIMQEYEYSSPEHAIFSLAEYSGLGHEAVPAFRAAWMRSVNEGSDPFQRVVALAVDTYVSQDADLLPRRKV